MRYRVDFAAIADATASVYVEAESQEEAQQKADAVDRTKLDWDISDVDDETIEEVGVVQKPRPPRRQNPIVPWPSAPTDV